MLKSFLILFSAFLILECAIIPALAIPRLAVIAETEDARLASDILAAQLSKSKDYIVLERDEIAKLFREQQLSMEGLTEQSDLSRLTGADGLIILRPIEKGSQRLLFARIVAVHPGVVLDTLSCPLPCPDYDAWALLLSTRIKQLLSKFEVLARDAIAISILNIRAEYETETTKSLERSLKKLLFTRLVQEPRVFVLERQNMDKLDWEKKLSLKSEDKFWTASYILEGSFHEASTNNISLNINLLAPNGSRITNIINIGAASYVEGIVDQTAIRILKALQIAPSSVLWSPNDEAQCYYQEALWAYRWNLHQESISAIESSWALGNQTEDVAFQRLQCYLQSLASENDTSFVVKRLLELYLDYRRLFLQMNLKTTARLEKDGVTWRESPKEEVKRAHDFKGANYYRDIINAASALFQKEEQNQAWGQQHHDILMDIRSLILTVCREIDKQAEKEQMTSPIKGLIITQGYYWYDNPHDYIASLYRSLEGRNDSRGTLFVAINGHVRNQFKPEEFNWPDKILEEFNRYGPEFNSGLCHSSNSVNRLIGHYCELKWATTNQVIITDSMDHLMDDLWESRNDVLSINTTFYIDTFNLWAEKSMVLPADTQELYNERILKFHRKYLVYAINARQIPHGWFRKIFENYLNMSLEEGLSFYNTHLTNSVSELEYVRSAFYVVYVGRKVLVDIQDKSATNSFRVKIDNYGLTRALEDRLHEKRQKSHNLPTNPTPPTPPPAPIITTSPYQSLVVTQYYSLADQIQDIAFANGKIWIALPNRLLMLDPNSFTCAFVHSIASPDMYWTDSRLFLDTGTEISCLSSNNHLLKQWSKPNGDKDFRFYVFQDNLFFYKHGLIIHLDIKSNNYQVIASTRRRPSQTLLDGTNFKVDRLFGSLDKLFALICYGPKGCGIYSFDPVSLSWSLNENFPWDPHVPPVARDHNGYNMYEWNNSPLIVRASKDGMLFYNAPGGSWIDFWSTKSKNKQLLLSPTYDEYGLSYENNMPKWTMPLSFDNNDSRIAEYDGNNFYIFSPPKYNDYQALLWFFEKGHEAGIPIQLNFLTNSKIRVTDVIQKPENIIIRDRPYPPNAPKFYYSSYFILAGCSNGLIMAMKNATGFWFLPFEDIRGYITQNNVLIEQKVEVPCVTVAPFMFCEGHIPKVGIPCTILRNGSMRPWLEIVWIPPGEFMMGSQLPENERGENETQHKVTITNGFWIGKYEVTQDQWQRVMGNNPSQFIGADLPVDGVTRDDCRKFIRKLNALIPSLNSKTNKFQFSLPTEAEWEYACRAGTTNRFYTGDSASDLDKAGWYSGNSGGTTHPVGQKQPNAWGLYDMHGNVQEWCADEPVAVQNPKGMNSGNLRVLRGGNNTSSPRDCRSATRFMADPEAQSSGYGFRIVLHP